jgi:2-methylcitrate dehydratase PrpD
MLDAAIAVRDQLGLGTSLDISEVAKVTMAGSVAIVDEHLGGAVHKRRPSHIVEAQFALPYLIAAAIVHGRVGIAEVGDIHNAGVLDIAANMAGAVVAPEKGGVTVLLRDGRSAAATVGHPLGSPENRLSAEQLTMKFTDCARNAVRPLPDDAVQAAIHMIGHLEDVPNVSEELRHFI